MPDLAPLVPGMYPFWFWNDRLSAEEIRWQVAQMAAQGVRGFLIHSRQGLGQPYLSDAFFAMVKIAIAAADEHGLVVHLYDEYPYPSGTAGGEVLLGNPEYLATHLVGVDREVEGGTVRLNLPAGRVLACVAYPLRDGQPQWHAGIDLRSAVGMLLTENSYVEQGLTAYNRKRFFASDPVPSLEAELPAGQYRLIAAIQALTTRHKYWGYFTDVMNPVAVRHWLNLTHERYRQHVGDRFGSGIGSIFVDETTPGWSACLPAAYAERYGVPLEPLLPAHLAADHPDHHAVTARLRELQLALFVESFEEPVRDWCHQHGVRYVGEKNNLRLSQLQYMDIPGCDPGHTKAGARPDYLEARLRGNARAIASAAWLYDKEGCLCECYHSLGWSGTLQDARLIAEGLILMGVDYLVPHGFFYSTHGLRKHDAPPSFFFQMPAWPLFGKLTSRLDRIWRELAGCRLDARLLLVDPTPGQPTSDDRKACEALLRALCEAHLDFLYIDVDSLERGDITANGEFRLREVDFAAVVVPPMRAPEPRLTAWLERFAAAGGHIHRPTPTTVKATVAALRQLAPPSLTVTGDEVERLLIGSRTDGQRRRWLVLNPTSRAVAARFSAAGYLTEIALDDNDVPRLLADGFRSIAPFESLLLAESAQAAPAAPLPQLHLEVAHTLTVEPHQPNLLRLGDWELTIAGQPGSARVSPLPLANQLAASKLPFTPLVKMDFGVSPSFHLPKLNLRYMATFHRTTPAEVALVMEPDSIAGEWRLRANDGPWLTAADFAPATAHVRGSLNVDLTPSLHDGDNQLIVEVTTDRHDGGLVNPLYLAGNFGVDLTGPTLIERPSQGSFEAWRRNGLPYYAGVVDYRMNWRLGAAPKADRVLVELALPERFEDACELSVNGHPWQPVLWSPHWVSMPAEWLQDGDNEVVIRVYTSLIRAFEGEWFDPLAHRYRPIAEGE